MNARRGRASNRARGSGRSRRRTISPRSHWILAVKKPFRIGRANKRKVAAIVALVIGVVILAAGWSNGSFLAGIIGFTVVVISLWELRKKR